MTKSQSQSSLARPAPPEIPTTAAPTNVQIDRKNGGIESTIQCKDKGTHLTPLPGEPLRQFSSKRCACSIWPVPKDRGISSFLEEAPRQRGGAMS